MTQEEVKQFMKDKGDYSFYSCNEFATIKIIEYYRYVDNVTQVILFTSLVDCENYTIIDIPPVLYEYIAMKLLTLTNIGKLA